MVFDVETHVIYMSVRTGSFAPGRADSHGHHPQNILTCANVRELACRETPTPPAIRVICDELAAPGDSDGIGHVVRLIEVLRGRVRQFEAFLNPLGVPIIEHHVHGGSRTRLARRRRRCAGTWDRPAPRRG